MGLRSSARRAPFKGRRALRRSATRRPARHRRSPGRVARLSTPRRFWRPRTSTSTVTPPQPFIPLASSMSSQRRSSALCAETLERQHTVRRATQGAAGGAYPRAADAARWIASNTRRRMTIGALGDRAKDIYAPRGGRRPAPRARRGGRRTRSAEAFLSLRARCSFAWGRRHSPRRRPRRAAACWASCTLRGFMTRMGRERCGRRAAAGGSASRWAETGGPGGP